MIGQQELYTESLLSIEKSQTKRVTVSATRKCLDIRWHSTAIFQDFAGSFISK